MSKVVDFLERMGSEAQWRNAPSDEIEQALTNAGIDTPVRDAILAKNAAAVQALLGQVKMMGYQLPGPHVPPPPSPNEVPQKPQPEPEKEEEEGGESGKSTSSQHAHRSSSLSSLSS